jgi:serine beta-lactamase-like protein LACTB, mitochondrial
MTSMNWFRRKFPRVLIAAVLISIGLFTGGTYAYAQTSLPYVEEQVPAAPKYAPAIEQGRLLLQSLMESSKVAGLSVAVAVDGDVVWTEGFGYADLENRVPVTPLTKFRVGSVSKSLTATGLAKLYEAGKVDLDANIEKYVPYFPEKQYPITARELGGHLGGIRTYNYANYDVNKNEFVSTVHYASVKDSINIFKDSPLEHKPGTKYLYSTYGFVTLSAVIEGASGQDYISYINEHVLQPLKLQNTLPEYQDAIVPYRTRYYMRNAEGKMVNAPYTDNSNKWSAGGWISTPSDLVRWGSAMIGPNFIKDDTKKIWWTSQKTTDGKETGYGIGFGIAKDFDGRRTVGHGGGSVGGTTTWVMFPDDGVVVAMTVNMSLSPMSNLTAETIAENFIKVRAGSAPSAPATDVSGNYEFTAQNAAGKQVSGTFALMKLKNGYIGRIVPEKEPPQPLRRSQDGSYGPPEPAEVSVASVSMSGNQVHIVGADSSGFIHGWFTLNGSTIDGKWTGRGVTGAMHGTKTTGTTAAGMVPPPNGRPAAAEVHQAYP